jgi:hypothetical protein
VSQIRILFRFLFAFFFTSFFSVLGGDLDSSESKILDVLGIWLQSSVMASRSVLSLAFEIACLSFSIETRASFWEVGMVKSMTGEDVV